MLASTFSAIATTNADARPARDLRMCFSDNSLDICMQFAVKDAAGMILDLVTCEARFIVCSRVFGIVRSFTVF